MSTPEPEGIIDSTAGFVGDHVRRYVESAGADGHDFGGLSTLLLTTRGRRSGLLRRTALIYGEEGTSYLVVASNGGSNAPPLWFENLVVDPHVTIQVRDAVLTGRARVATVEERLRIWPAMVEIFPRYETYAGTAEREIPIVIVDPD